MTNQNTLADLSSTAALNLNIKGQSQQGTAPASTIDSIFQKYGASLHDFYNSLGGVATVSGTDTYTVTITEDWAALASGLVLAIKVANANTGAATLNVTVPTAGALGAKAIRRQGDSALQANDMVANGVYLLRYDAAYNSAAGAWVLLNPASSIATPISVANGGTNISSYTAGDILYASAATTLTKLAKGTAAQMLEMNSGATAPQWGAASGLKLLTSGTVSSAATLDIVLTSYTGYRGFLILLNSFIPATDNTSLYARLSGDGGSSFDAGAAAYHYSYTGSGDGTAINTGGSAAQIELINNIGNGSAEGGNHAIEMMDVFNSALKQKVKFRSIVYQFNDLARETDGGGFRNTAAISNAIRILYSSGNIASGSYAVYGYP